MPRTLTIHADALRYVLPHVSTEESRPNLQGVLFEPTGLAVATNGYTLGAHRHATEPHARAVVLRFHEPRKLLASKVDTITVEIPDALDADGAHGWNLPVTLYGKLGASHAVGATFADMLDASGFPLWRTVYRPATDPTPVASIGLDPELAARFTVGAKGYAAKISVTFDGASGAALVRYPSQPDALGLWMPCRDIVTGSAADAWRDLIAPPARAPEPATEEPTEEPATVGV